MIDVGPGRWRIVQLAVFLLVGTALVVTDSLAPSIGIDAEDPLMLAVGAALVGYTFLAAAWEAILVGTDLARSLAGE
jgi:energy-converting hydrogenase Eha subunit E